MEDIMKKGTKIFIVVLVVIAIIAIGCFKFFAGTYNKIVALDEQVSNQWAQVENQYQRRLDLVPNLVATVKGYAKHESSVYTEDAQNSLGGALQRLLSVTENYPQLQANQNFLALQDELEGTENRISTERKRFNDVAQTYNTFIRQFPRNIVANMNGFRAKQYFAAADEAQKAPAVKFD